MTKKIIDPVVQAGEDIAADMGVSLLQLGCVMSLLESASKRHGGTITIAEAANYNLTVGDVSDIQTSLRRKGVVDTVRAALAAAAQAGAATAAASATRSKPVVNKVVDATGILPIIVDAPRPAPAPQLSAAERQAGIAGALRDVASELRVDLPQLRGAMRLIDAAALTKTKQIDAAGAEALGLDAATVEHIRDELARVDVMEGVREAFAIIEPEDEDAPQQRAAALNMTRPPRIVAASDYTRVKVAASAARTAPPLWQQELAVIAEAHGFSTVQAVMLGGGSIPGRSARWDMIAHLSQSGWKDRRIGRTIGDMDEDDVRDAISQQVHFGQAADAMETLLDIAAPVTASTLPRQSFAMHRVRSMLPAFKELEDTLASVPLPHTTEECFTDVNGKVVLTPGGRKIVAGMIRGGLDQLAYV